MINYIIKIVCISLMLFCCCLQPEGRAEDGYMESINGADQEFTYGYAQAERVRAFEQGIQERQETESGLIKPTSAEAEGQPWRLRKGFRFSTLYDSNLFYSRTDTKDDVLFIYTPFAGVSLGKKNISRLYLNAFYELNYVDYVEVQKFSRFNQTLSFEAHLHEEKYDLNFKNTLKPLSARETGERTELASPNNNRVIAWTDNAQIEGVYHLRPKVDLTATYDYSYVLFPASSNQTNPDVELFSYQKNTFTPGIAYKYSPKTTFFLNGSAGYTDYFKGGEFSQRNYRAAAGVKNRLTLKTDLTFQAAYGRTDYLAERFQPAEGPQFSASVRHQLTPRISGTLSVDHSINEALDFRSLSTELVDSLKSE